MVSRGRPCTVDICEILKVPSLFHVVSIGRPCTVDNCVYGGDGNSCDNDNDFIFYLL